jgi:hypothetical protein
MHSSQQGAAHNAGKFTMAYNGGFLGTLARVKAVIMMQGGVLTAIAYLPGFGEYPGTPPKALYNQEVPSGVEPEWHAVFCYGVVDSASTPGAGYWLCKNRCPELPAVTADVYAQNHTWCGWGFTVAIFI